MSVCETWAQFDQHKASLKKKSREKSSKRFTGVLKRLQYEVKKNLLGSAAKGQHMRSEQSRWTIGTLFQNGKHETIVKHLLLAYEEQGVVDSEDRVIAETPAAAKVRGKENGKQSNKSGNGGTNDLISLE